MEEKLYRPIIKEGDHLVKSKANENRVRGVSQDLNNKTTDIIEWEEVEIKPVEYYCECDENYYESKSEALTKQQQELAEIIGNTIADIVIHAAGQCNEYIIGPWWRSSAKPWIKEKATDVKQIILGKTKAERRIKENKKPSNTVLVDTNSQIDKMLDREFDSIQFDMSSEESKDHVMKLIYHMLGIAYEIRILSNTRIVTKIEDTKMRLENQSKAESLLTEKVVQNINELLSEESQLLDIPTSKQIFELLGGGIRLNGTYVPVELEKVSVAISSMKTVNKKVISGV